MLVQPNIVIPQLIQAFQKGDFQHVVDVIGGNASLVTVDPVVVQLYGSALRKLGQMNKAVKVYEKGLKKFKQAPDLMNSYGNLLLDIEQSSKAVEWFQKAIRFSPNSYDYQYNLSRALIEQERFSQAKNTLNQLLTIKKDNASVYLLLAEIATKEKNSDKAQEYFQKILSNDPNHLIALNNLGNLMRMSGDLKSAESLYSRALIAGGNSPQVYLNLAAVLGLQSKVNEALNVYKKGLERFPYDRSLHGEFAHFAWIKNVDEPFVYLERQLDESVPELVLVYCELMLRIDEAKKAKDWLVKLQNIEVPSLKLNVLANLSNALRDLGDFNDALIISEKGLKQCTGDTLPLLIEKGYALLSLKEYNQATQVFEKVCRLAPMNQGYWTLLATAYKGNKNYTQYEKLCDYGSFVRADRLIEGTDEAIRFNEQLKSVLLTMHRGERHPIGQSLRNGSQTFENLLDNKNTVIQSLKELILQRAVAYIKTLSPQKKHPLLSRLSTDIEFIGSWSVKLRQSGFHKSHYHSDGWISGVLYIDVPDEVKQNGNGWLIFGKPDINGVSMEEDYAIKPQVGEVVFFPSYAWHGTRPINSDSQRMTVAFDIIPKI